MALAAPSPPPVPIREGEHGVLLIGNTRVTLDSVIYAFQDGATPEDIIGRYPSLALPDVYSVIAYYLSDRTAVDSYVARRRAQIDALRLEVESRFPQDGIREQIMARRRKAGL